jgi:DNA-binding NtrC family response regulator
MLVEDDESLRHVLGRELSRMGFEVTTHATGAGAAERVAAVDPDTLLLDLHLPDVSGLEVLAQVTKKDNRLPVVVFTGQGTVETAVQAMQAGAFDFLTKPVALDVLEHTLRRAIQHTQLLRDNERLRRATAHAAAGALAVPVKSEQATRLELRIARIATSSESVLIFGESGTGKELVARRLHADSPRHKQPFVVVNCGAIPQQLVESELFGHLKGAFSGADQKRPGMFEAADGGTLFLDEIGELPLDVQPALLRALQFGEIRPVGSDQVRHVDVRFLAATHRDLRADVKDGRFREDLFYRLAVLELKVPALRDRSDDIEPLAQAFLRRESARSGRELHLHESAIERLGSYAWPGNVRELENAIVRIGVLVDGPEITASDIDEIVFVGRPADAERRDLPSLDLHTLEQQAIDAALQQCEGNKTRAAAMLGIALKTLYNKLNARKGRALDEDDL